MQASLTFSFVLLHTVMDPAVFWPTVLGISFLVAGIFTYRQDLLKASSRSVFRLASLGPVFIAAALAAFAGEHFTAASSLAQMVPKWLPARLFIAYFVGAAHLAAALSLVARRYIRWSSFFLALMFALFVLLLHLPNAVEHAANRVFWIFPARETTYAMGGLALFATEMSDAWPNASRSISAMARIWTALVLIYFGTQNVLYPQFSPGVPDTRPALPWVPLPHLTAYITGILLMAFGIAMFLRKYAASAGASAGLFMVLLTVVLYIPDFFLAQTVPEDVTAVNFFFDTLLFAGTLLVIATAISRSESGQIGKAQTAS
ncbi:MAG TPA: hypothetical protein VKW78_06580 [Terriglobales bacterium]|nr:hypothetical protein [Terriglobales bacterium]